MMRPVKSIRSFRVTGLFAAVGRMGDMDLPQRVNHPAWITLAASTVSYGLGLLGLFVLLFVVPFLLFLLL
jgi:hypothetical protein